MADPVKSQNAPREPPIPGRENKNDCCSINKNKIDKTPSSRSTASPPNFSRPRTSTIKKLSSPSPSTYSGNTLFYQKAYKVSITHSFLESLSLKERVLRHVSKRTTTTSITDMPFIDPKARRRTQSKRLIICCDGTWQNSDDGIDEDPTNVTRISRAIKSHSDEGMQQIVFYQNGVGSAGKNKLTRMISGGTGLGLMDNVAEAYMFLANNYHPGDEIFLFGFSRGAYTARSIAGLIGRIGVLTKASCQYFHEVYRAYQSFDLQDDDFVAKQTHWERVKGVRVKVIGCWDTVGSLGLPENRLVRALKSNKKYQFHDTALGPGIENAFHALALDERRKPFTPTLWRLEPHTPSGDATAKDTEGVTKSQILPKGNSETDTINVSDKPTVLKQVWFPGVHTNVGGGYVDQEIADVTLFWMIEQVAPFLTFDALYLASIYERRAYHDPKIPKGKYHGKKEKEIAVNEEYGDQWALGRVYTSDKGITCLTGRKVRTPGQYYTDTRKQEISSIGHVGHTNEEVHASVRARFERTSGKWHCNALGGWNCHKTLIDGEEKWVWVNKEKHVALLEAKVGSLERMLCSNKVYDEFKQHTDEEKIEKINWAWSWFRRASKPDSLKAVTTKKSLKEKMKDQTETVKEEPSGKVEEKVSKVKSSKDKTDGGDSKLEKVLTEKSEKASVKSTPKEK